MKGYPSKRRWCRLFVVAALLSAIGCGTAEYERRMSATLSSYRSAGSSSSGAALEDFDSYLPQNAISGGKVNLRLPTVFSKAFDENALDPKASPPVTPATIYPAGVKLRGYGRTWEATIEASDGSRWPYYIHLAASRSPGIELEEFALEVEQQLKAANLPTPARWEDVTLATPEGAEFPAKKMRIEADMTFFDARAGSEQRYPGVVELYVVAAGEYQVIVSSQCMKNFEEHINLGPLLKVAAGTLQIANQSPAAL